MINRIYIINTGFRGALLVLDDAPEAKIWSICFDATRILLGLDKCTDINQMADKRQVVRGV